MRLALPLAIVLTAASTGACQSVPPQPEPDRGAVTGTLDRKSPEAQGLELARNRCADCHSVSHGDTSPVPHAPSFSAIASSRGLTNESLAGWLRDHGNYPDEMYFEIPAEHIADLAAYMVTLRRHEPQ